MDSIDKIIDKNKGSKRLPPLVLPDTAYDSCEFKPRLIYFSASSNAFKWDQTNINSKTKKFLARNGFNSLFWSSIICDDSILTLVIQLFGDNIKLISDEEFEPTFGISLNKSAQISSAQLTANYFLLFAIPAKSHNQYLYEWMKRRLDAYYRTVRPFFEDQNWSDFDSHPELFLATKRRFYVYKDLVPALTLFAINSLNKRTDITKELFRQIYIAISYSGLQTFHNSWNFTKGIQTLKVGELEVIKEDIKRITAARNVIIDKYSENVLPFARLLNIPEVEALNRCNYPDLAFCGHHYKTHCKDLSQDYLKTMNNIIFRPIKTKTPKDTLKQLSLIKNYNSSQMTAEEIFGFMEFL